jgi:serine phosphatase RsbU (regulator of sigma subunit)
MGTVGGAHGGQGGYPALDWGVASRTKTGEVESGDQYFVRQSNRRTLLAVVDGLGHGGEAAAAAYTAINLLQQAEGDEPIAALVKRCHIALQTTRGAVMGLAALGAEDNEMQWLGIGNIESVVCYAHPDARPRVRPLLSRGGIVGHRLPVLLASALPLARGDVLVLATDGVHTDFTGRLTSGEPVQGMADRILAQYAKETDDALVLVVRYLGGAR